MPYTTLRRLEAILKEEGLEQNELVRSALTLAQRVHAQQKRDGGQGYLEEHVYWVTAQVIEYCRAMGRRATPELVAAALLHNVLEDDRSIPREQFRQTFGEDVYRTVRPLAKPELESFAGRTEEEKSDALNARYFKGLENAPDEAKSSKTG